jgi:hypothetical protein
MSQKHFASQIAKTGFVLENQIAQQLRAAKWTVISNRYYVDDAEESVREIDLIAYQATRVQHFDVYTTLIISCKKSESNAWALLARDLDLKDPNTDWQPLHAWSNDKALAYQLAGTGCARRYHDELTQLGVNGPLQLPGVEVFAFQEMNKSSGAPQNDKSIFAAVTSLMKAQAYELGSLPQRKKTAAVYQFNLLSVVDTDLIRLMFSGQTVTPAMIESEHYIARYIIKKRETFSRIRFLTASTFATALPEYGMLHAANCRWFASECNAFYENTVEDDKKTAALLDDFRKAVAWHIRWPLIREGRKAPEASSISLYWGANTRVLNIYASLNAEDAKIVNDDAEAKNGIADALQKIYRFSGTFKVDDDDIPF